jgi:hypothetical protein
MLTETKNSLLCDWSMLSFADLALAAGKMHKNLLFTGGFWNGFSEPKAAFRQLRYKT